MAAMWPGIGGYSLVLLSEYYLLTGDEYVRPAIKTYAVALAKGQDAGRVVGPQDGKRTRRSADCPAMAISTSPA